MMLFFSPQGLQTLCLEGDLRGSLPDMSFRVYDFQAHFWKHMLAVIMDEVNRLLPTSWDSMSHALPSGLVTHHETRVQMSAAHFSSSQSQPTHSSASCIKNTFQWTHSIVSSAKSKQTCIFLF